jgi:hypothetical protein
MFLVVCYLMPNGRYVELENMTIIQLIDIYSQLKPIRTFNIHAPEHVLLHLARKIFLCHLSPYQMEEVLNYCV